MVWMASHSSVTVNEISDPDRACRLNEITSIWNKHLEQAFGIQFGRFSKSGSPSLESGNIRCSKFRIKCRPDVSRSRSGLRRASREACAGCLNFLAVPFDLRGRHQTLLQGKAHRTDEEVSV